MSACIVSPSALSRGTISASYWITSSFGARNPTTTAFYGPSSLGQILILFILPRDHDYDVGDEREIITIARHFGKLQWPGPLADAPQNEWE